jgi:hypothetical protein
MIALIVVTISTVGVAAIVAVWRSRMKAARTMGFISEQWIAQHRAAASDAHR